MALRTRSTEYDFLTIFDLVATSQLITLQCADVKFTSSALVSSSLPSNYVSQCVKKSASAPTSTGSVSNSHPAWQKNHELSTGAILSIIFSLVVVSIFMAIGFLVLKRRKAKRKARAIDQRCMSDGEDVPLDDRLPSYNEAVHDNVPRR
jgi:hypothetical protein